MSQQGLPCVLLTLSEVDAPLHKPWSRNHGGKPLKEPVPSGIRLEATKQPRQGSEA